MRVGPKAGEETLSGTSSRLGIEAEAKGFLSRG